MLLPSCLRCWLTSVTICVLHLFSTSHASSRWIDQEPNLISQDSFQNFRSFQGQHFGSMTLNNEQRLLMVGAQNAFYQINLEEPLGSQQGIQNYSWSSEYVTIENCLMKGVEQWECQNFIEVLQMNSADNNRLFACGTNAQSPKCRYFTDSSLQDYVESDGTFISPFNPKQEGTALFADGNLYTGVARDYTARDSVIFRSQGTQKVLYTKIMDSTWLKIPAFIKSFDVGDWILFFFREVAVEYTSGEGIYSRVAKVCKNDQGGSWISVNEWTTFQKIRLNCSLPGAIPFYFHFLQDVEMVESENDTLFYTVFTTGGHEIPGSAVCVFSLNKIRTIMNEGEFKEQQGGAWYPASPPPQPPPTPPRPGLCDADYQSSASLLQWISSHPLMHEAVPTHKNPLPIFTLTRADYRLTQIMVHSQRAVDSNYQVLFLGTDDSKLLKVVLVETEDGAVHTNLLEEISLHPKDSCEKVINMEPVTNHEGKQVILVNTNSSILEVPLQRCINYTSDCTCTQDPFCVWNSITDECYEYTGDNAFDEQDVSNMQECPEEPPPPTTPQPECICETTAPSAAATTKYTTVMATTPSTVPRTTTAVPTTPTTVSTTIIDLTTTVNSSTVLPVGSHQPSESTTDGELTGGEDDNNISEGKLPSSLPPSTTISNVIGPVVISDVDILEVATTITNEVDDIHGDKRILRPDVYEYPQRNHSLMEEGNVLVLVFLILGWILFTFCGMVVLYQCYNQHHKGMKTKEQKDLLSTPNQNGKVGNGIPLEVPWSPPSRATHTPAGRERDSLGPVNGHSLPRRPVPVPTPMVPPAYRSPVSFAHTVGSLPSPARINKYKNNTSTFNSLDRHRTPQIHNLYVEHPRSHANEPYSPYNGRVMTAEDRRPSGASDSEMYDDDVWQPRMAGEELV
ncbi:semaphorin-1A-like isoform X4 [Lytechinus variegatus]|uniref:semaphorin-1A-like isoform X4 n=1 Tax=Lytechinus variegatus TaxID=7654 RepID=UPI001BB2378C|nr:semaphorin-1A-like isoform X4 [Lytechinus variegatus]